MNKLTLLVALIAILQLNATAQLKRPAVLKYTPSEYGQRYSPNALSVTEDENGIVYMGTVSGVLQFDGVTWNSITVKAGNYVTALAQKNNNVYIGGIGEFGYLKANQVGKYEYVSLTKKIPVDEFEFTRVWSILKWGEKIAFQAQEAILLFSNDTVEIIKPETSFHLAFTCNNNLIVRERGKGLLNFSSNKFEFILGSEIFSEVGVFAILSSPEGSIVVTQEIGLWRFLNGKFLKIKLGKRVEQILNRAEIVGAINLDDGNYALYTLKQGVIILNSNFELVTNFTVNTGLLSSEIYNLIQDSNGDLWAATSKGLNRIQYSSPFSIFNQSIGLFGDVQSVSKFGENFLVGTTQGLFTSSTEGIKAFTEVQEVIGSVWAIKQTATGYWIGTSDGLWHFDGNRYERISRLQSSALQFIPEKNWIVSVGNMGMLIFDAKSKKMLLNQRDVKFDAFGIAYKLMPNGSVELWIGSVTSGAWQVLLHSDAKMQMYDVYGQLDGLDDDWVMPHRFGNQVFFAYPKGLMRFVSAEDMYRLLKDTTFSVFELRGMFAPIDFPKGVYDKAVTAIHFNPKTSYIGLDYNVNSLNMSDSTASDFHFKAIRVGKINAIEQFDNYLLIAARDGLVVANTNEIGKRKYPTPKLLLRSISIGADSVVWWGDATIDNREVVIPYSLNNLKVNLSSNYFDNGSSAEYSWMIKGVDKDFSRWSTQASISLSNFREGTYEFVAVARNIHGELSNEVSFRFVVLPPWYRTIYAYISYALALIALVYLLVQMNIKRLKAQNKRLEELVQQRTREVVEQKEHIEQQKERIEDILRDIRASINYAQRIQQALLPSRDLIEKFLPGHFIIFYPRDVVSGDFYWATRVNDWVVVTVADCTGHGVPGAFMSMLGISLLNEIVGKQSVVEPSRILGDMRQGIIEALKQGSEHATQKDGMDMSIVAINLKTRVCKWAGANNPLYIVRSRTVNAPLTNMNEKNKLVEFDCCTLLELKQDRMPVAIHTVMEDFLSHEVQLHAGDRLYMFSDGYTDQFGGNDYRKFMSKAFKELVATTSGLPIDQQGRALEAAFREWVNCNGQVHEQIDDVTVMGIEI